MDARPIGVFDSGLGGLTAVRALRQARRLCGIGLLRRRKQLRKPSVSL